MDIPPQSSVGVGVDDARVPALDERYVLLDERERHDDARQFHPVRRRVREVFVRRADMCAEEAMDAEKGVFNANLQWADTHGVARSWSNARFMDTYCRKANSVVDNLDPSCVTVGNRHLRERVGTGDILPHEVAFLTPDKAFPERWKAVLETKVQHDNFTYNQKPEAMTDQFRCRKCHKRKCVYYEQQTRSCDEPMSLFITCISCGNGWRIG